MQNAYEFASSIDSYYEALELVPDPLESYDATTWLLTAIRESNLLCGEHENARDVPRQAMHCPDAIRNPFPSLNFRTSSILVSKFQSH